MKWGKISLVIVGALIVTALGIDAADTLTGSKSTLLSQVISNNGDGGCPQGMVAVSNIPTLTCIDAYEVSTGEKCPVDDPGQTVGTLQNMNTKDCVPESKKEATPWRFVTRDQAMQMCARVGKRMPTSEEWYTLSLGMVATEQSCNVSSQNVSVSGAFEECVSPHGAYDIVGNVWEWVSDDVVNGQYRSTQVPESGYVAQVDSSGMATVVSDTAQDLFEKDYFWSRSDGAYGIIRGGYYGSGSDAGIYTVHADTPPTSASAGIGFRCAL